MRRVFLAWMFLLVIVFTLMVVYAKKAKLSIPKMMKVIFFVGKGPEVVVAEHPMPNYKQLPGSCIIKGIDRTFVLTGSIKWLSCIYEGERCQIDLTFRGTEPVAELIRVSGNIYEIIPAEELLGEDFIMDESARMYVADFVNRFKEKKTKNDINGHNITPKKRRQGAKR